MFSGPDALAHAVRQGEVLLAAGLLAEARGVQATSAPLAMAPTPALLASALLQDGQAPP